MCWAQSKETGGNMKGWELAMWLVTCGPQSSPGDSVTLLHGNRCCEWEETTPMKISLWSNLIETGFLKWLEFCTWTREGFLEQRKPMMTATHF